MNIDGIIHKFPEKQTNGIITREQEKAAVEDLIQEAIHQIQRENRSPTKWEIDALSQAIAQILYGRYKLSVQEVLMSTKGPDEIARPEHWWRDADDIDLDKLQRVLNCIKGFPAI